MGDIDDQNNIVEDEQQQQSNRPAGQSEGAAPEPAAAEVEALYKDLGIKAPVPTGKAKGRPKTSDVRTKNSKQNGAGNSNSGQEENDDDKGQSKNARSANKDGDSGNDANAKGSKVSSKDGGVQDESEEADAGVRSDKSRSEEDSKRGSEEDADKRASGDESAEHDQDGKAEGESDDEKDVKRPGKSNPAVEARIQKLANEKKAAEQRAADLERQLQQQAREREQAKIAQEDPEYTVDDFRKVRDREGNIIDLDPERAELAWRRWKDGWDERQARREAEANRTAALTAQEEHMTQELMQKSVAAYDTLASLMDEYPELVSTSGKFDEDFAAEAMPIIQESIEYLEGTEPGNAEGNLPVIVGLKLHPKKILDALKRIDGKKRSLPLNGLNDNVESRSNVNVPHSRSSDPTIHAANELYKDLGIDKRL